MAASDTSAEGPAAALDSTKVPKVSVVVPAFNEAERIGESIRRIEDFLLRAPFTAEVVIVDDGSRDDTSAIVRNVQARNLRLIRNNENHGKGYAVRMGFLASAGEYVLFSDADLSAPIEELDKLLSAAISQSADIVIGSRAVDRTFIERHQSWMREAGGIAFNSMVRLILRLKIHDTQCGFKLFRRERVRPVFERLRIEGFGFDPEVLFLAARANLKILELPVRWSHAEGSKIRLFRDGTRMFSDLVRIRWNYFQGRYS